MADIDKGLPSNTRTEVKVPGAEEVEVKRGDQRTVTSRSYT